MTAPGFDHLPGTRLPEGSFAIPADEDRRLRELIHGRPPHGGRAHPIWAFITSLRGMGITIGETLALAGLDIESDGPMQGECEIELSRPLCPDVPYRVTGEIVRIERKRGRSLGTFDLLRLRYVLADEQGEVASYTSVIVLPRRDAA